MVVHYNRLKPYLGDQYQPAGQFEDGPEEGTPGRATGDSVGDYGVDDDNVSDNDSEQEEEEPPLLTPVGGSHGLPGMDEGYAGPAGWRAPSGLRE